MNLQRTFGTTVAASTYKLNYILLLGLPLLLFIVAIAFIEIADIDRRLASIIYTLGGNEWTLRHHWVTDQLVHEYGRHLTTMVTFITIGLLVSSWLHSGLRAGRRVFGYLLLAPVLTTSLIQTLKHKTNMDCPYNVNLFGGENTYFTLWQSRPLDNIAHYCFPAGHASAGYCWVALFFVFHYLPESWKPRCTWLKPKYGLAYGLALGLIFGLSQQLRGAHFISHDIWTATICWLCSGLLAYFLLERAQPKFTDLRHT